MHGVRSPWIFDRDLKPTRSAQFRHHDVLGNGTGLLVLVLSRQYAFDRRLGAGVVGVVVTQHRLLGTFLLLLSPVYGRHVSH